MSYIASKKVEQLMLNEKEIKETFELLGIKITEDKDKENEIHFNDFIDKHPLNVKFQTTTKV